MDFEVGEEVLRVVRVLTLGWSGWRWSGWRCCGTQWNFVQSIHSGRYDNHAARICRC